MSSASPPPQSGIHRDDSGVDMGAAKPAKDSRPRSAWVRYRTEFRHRTTDELLVSRETESIPVPDTTEDDAVGDEPIFELITTYIARQQEPGRQAEAVSSKPEAVSSKPEALSSKPEALSSKPEETNRLATTLLAKPRYHLNIFSPAIANALQSVVRYYPSQFLTDDPIVVPWPYPVLVHHYEKLAEFRDAAAAKDPHDMCMMERDADEHISLLLKFLDHHVMEGVRAEQERNMRGLYTWEYAWMYYKPGTTWIQKLLGGKEESVSVIQSVHGGVLEPDSRRYTITEWSMEYNGQHLGRRSRETFLDKFDGVEVHSSVCFLDVADMSPGGARVEDLPEMAQKHIEYGRRYWKLLKKQCKYHRGKSREFPFNEIESLVMVDLDSYFEEKEATPRYDLVDKEPVRKTLMTNEDCRSSSADGACAFCKDQKGKDHEGKTGLVALFDDYNFIVPADHDELSSHKYLLCPAIIKAFVFKTRVWETVHVRNLSEPEFEESMIDGLVMDKARKTTLMSLAKSFGRRNKLGEEMPRGMWSADFVKGKGAGLLFLLHGRPGVGKTSTAECIAAFTRRPLMVVASSDIIGHHVEKSLTRIFKTAVNWQCVLLIDEADVFMERRTTADFGRNSFVAGFLRALEHYDGILFLTTNRVGAFDDAFISRIHVQLFYPEFTDEQRQLVWKTFMEKLARERGDYIRLNIDAKEYIRGTEMRAVQWNGREIRNALQTAAALAEYDAEKDEEGKILITDVHLKAVVELSADFKTYLNELHRGDEAKRAERKYERLDDRVKTPSKA